MNKKQIIISKEDAVFWMDENGHWHNEHGRFEHPRIIKYFNASIKKDAQGYYLAQSRDGMEEKVYFKYQETAVFIVGLKETQEGLVLGLNTGETIGFDPSRLQVKNDSLYLNTDEHLMKFTSQAMVRLSRYLQEDEDGRLVFSFRGKDNIIG